MRTTTRLLTACCLIGLVTVHAHAALPIISGEPAQTTKSGGAQAVPFALPEASVHATGILRLRSLPADRLQRLQLETESGHKQVQIGLARDAALEAVSAVQLTWTALPDGSHATRFSAHSPGALALRVGLASAGLPAGATLRVRGAAAAGAIAASGSDILSMQLDSGLYWTAVTDGEQQDLELQLPPGTDASAVRVRIAQVSHLLADTQSQFGAIRNKNTTTGTAASCHEDVSCVNTPSEAFRNASRAVARMLYTRNGNTYLCTGTLVNDVDTSSQVPYFMTAAHCMNSQDVAGTLNTFWFFEATYCRSRQAGAYQQLTGGARLLQSNAATDVALLRLNDRAPQGSYFAAWDPNPIADNASVISLHHPAGDLKKVSSGLTLPASQAGVADTSTITAVTWVSGTTEPGSSGGGLFTLSGNEYTLRGVLRGGSASCASSGKTADPSNRDYFARLDQDYTSIKQALSAAVAPMEDYTDLWWTPGENGSGMSITQHPNNSLVAVWYTYDEAGKPLWLLMADSKWASVSELSGVLYRTTGPRFDGAYDQSKFAIQPLGNAVLKFDSIKSGTFTYTVNGVSRTKRIERLAF